MVHENHSHRPIPLFIAGRAEAAKQKQRVRPPGWTHIYADTWTDRQADRQTDRQTDRRAEDLTPVTAVGRRRRPAGSQPHVPLAGSGVRGEFGGPNGSHKKRGGGPPPAGTMSRDGGGGGLACSDPSSPKLSPHDHYLRGPFLFWEMKD